MISASKNEKSLKSKNDPKRALEAFNLEFSGNLTFKIRKFKSYFLLGKLLEKNIDGRGVSAPQKYSDFFHKISIEKAIF